jgi:hypothetical protein
MKERTSMVGARICELCKTSFNARAPKSQLQEHVDSKHAKLGFAPCFPGYVEA